MQRAQSREDAQDRMAAIEVEHLTKRYGARTAVDDVSFTVGDGEIVGFLGPRSDAH